jgi:hypothetical protein
MLVDVARFFGLLMVCRLTAGVGSRLLCRACAFNRAYTKALQPHPIPKLVFSAQPRPENQRENPEPENWQWWWRVIEVTSLASSPPPVPAVVVGPGSIKGPMITALYRLVIHWENSDALFREVFLIIF